MSRCNRILCFFLFTGVLVRTQEYRATITGRVSDAQNAVVPGATITAILVATSAKFETTSSSAGAYTLPFLPPGGYKFSAQASGFKRYLRENLVVSSGERIALDIRLELGELTETINVTAETPLLETATATTGQVIVSRQVENMPLNGRTPLVLAQLAMGIVPNSDPRFNRPFDNAGPSGFSMGGAPAQSNELLVDGSPDTTGYLRVAYNPPVDAVDEIRVHTFEADAAYGHTGGGTVNVVMKSGTNDLHGAAYEFNQVSALAATPFFTNLAGLVKPVTRYNQWGVTAGGPFWIPKVFNGRNKVFWFFGYEGVNDSFPEPITTTVPTPAERNGDFMRLLKSGGSNYKIYNPFTALVQSSHVTRQAFENNVIPPNLLNPIAKAYLQFYPLPNQPGRPEDGRDNYLANSVRRDTFNNELGRIDFNFSDRNKIFWNLRHNDRTENRGNLFNNIATGNFLSRVNLGSTVDDVFTFNPTTVMNIRLNWTRFIEGNAKPSNGFKATTLGFPAFLEANATRLVLPRIDFSSCGSHNNFECLGDNAGDRVPFDSYQIFADVVKIRGKHSLKIGADVRLLRESSVSYGNTLGTYTFRTDWTRSADNATASPLGADFAAFLLGLPSGGSLDVNSTRTDQQKYFALFLQDDWRVKSNLSFNLGLRFERDLPLTERYNRATNGFDAIDPNPIAQAAQAAYAKNPISQIAVGQFEVPGGLLFAGRNHRDIFQTHGHYFSRRFGFAWTPGALGGNTVIRGGIGVFLVPLGVQSLSGASYVNQTAFSQSTSVVSTLNSYLSPNATLGNPFPGGIEEPTGSLLGLATYLGKSFDFANPHPLNPYSVRWEFSIQRQLPSAVILEAAYIGNHAVHLQLDKTQFDAVPAKYLSTSPARDQATIDTLSSLVNNPFAGLIPGTNLNGATVARSQLLLPFPEFTGVQERQDSKGSSYFHSLAVRFEKRYSHGFNLLANYTYSKLIERVSRLNDTDLFLEKRVSGDDRPHRVVASASYELPFGKGKKFSRGDSRRWTRVFGGFVVNGIYTWQIGAPLGWGSLSSSNPGSGPIYLGGDLHLNSRAINDAFDTSRFVTNSKLQLADNIRVFSTRFGSLRQDGSNNFDLSLLKNTPITEKVNFQLRFEAFNALNHPTFNAPDLSPTSSSFGTIRGQANLPRSIQLGGRIVW